jgi:hypothetical protein
VPRAEIDFGDGRRLTRTLNGNVAVYFCDSAGRVLDIAPGLASPAEVLRRARLALRLHTDIAPLRQKERALRDYHSAMRDLETAPATAIRRAADEAARRFDRSKRAVEHGLKAAVRNSIAAAADPAAGTHELDAETAQNRAERMPKVHDLVAEHPLALPADLTHRVYRDILDVDLDDPWLGLAPYVLGGEPGRE